MIGELIEKLIIANVKLYNICDEKSRMADSPENYTKSDMARVMGADIELCKQRAALKRKIDAEVNSAIIDGRTDVIDEVKNYG